MPTTRGSVVGKKGCTTIMWYGTLCSSSISMRLRLRIFFSKFLFARVEIRLGNLYNIRQTHLIMRIKLSYLERCTCLLRSFNVLTSVEVNAYTDRSKQILLVTNLFIIFHVQQIVACILKCQRTAHISQQHLLVQQFHT